MPTPVTNPTALQVPGATTPAASTQRPNPKGTLDKDDLLKLFVAQMQKQDPSQPMDNAAMMGQMASFSTLEQMGNLTKVNEEIAAGQGQSNAIGLIGRTVTYTDDAGAIQTGPVEKVSTTAKGGTVLTVGGVSGVKPAAVTQVT